MPSISNSVEFRCYECKAPCATGYTDEGDPAFIHTMPMCKRFDSLETPDEHLEWLTDCRKAPENGGSRHYS